MPIIGAHVLLYTSEPDRVRAIFRDVFGFKHVDAGEGWLIFALPPAELGIHPTEGHGFKTAPKHEFSLMCDDVHATVQELKRRGVDVKGEPTDQGYGISVMVALPGGLDMQLYEPRHKMAITSAPQPTRPA